MTPSLPIITFHSLYCKVLYYKRQILSRKTFLYIKTQSRSITFNSNNFIQFSAFTAFAISVSVLYYIYVHTILSATYLVASKKGVNYKKCIVVWIQGRKWIFVILQEKQFYTQISCVLHGFWRQSYKHFELTPALWLKMCNFFLYSYICKNLNFNHNDTCDLLAFTW